ncbi:MAG: BON domain-containing protein [Myxococcales bacterium]|nr:BON domain-containing protein [Myxococcales bacterium]
MTTPTRPGHAHGEHVIPRSYDELVRETMVLPDGSHRPTLAEEQEALRRAPPPFAPGARLTPIRWALGALDDIDLHGLELALAGGRVVLTGTVASRADRERVVAAIEAVPGVEGIDDRLRILGG